MAQTVRAESRDGSSTSAERRLVIGGLLSIGVSFGFARYGYGLFLPDIRRSFDLSVSFVGIIGSATYLGYLVALLLVGAYSARTGPRLLVGIGGASAVCGLGLIAIAPNVAVLTVGLVLAGTSPAWAWAPYSDAVDLVVASGRRERVLAIIPAGTAVGTAVVGPLALFVHGASWRYAWMAMAAVAVVVAVFNTAVVPGRRPSAPDSVPAGRIRYATRAAIPLYVAALSYGLVGSFYWNYATETITRATRDDTAVALFWTLIGLAGTTGVVAGWFLARWGLRRAAMLLFGSITLAVSLLAAAPGSPLATGLSAVLYGPAFMGVSSLLAVWSYQTFPGRPTSGFTATLIFLGIGTIVGPATLGLVAELYGLRIAFSCTALLALASLCARAPASGRR